MKSDPGYLLKSFLLHETNQIHINKMSIIHSPIDHFDIEHFGKSHFGTNFSSREHFGTRIVWCCGCSNRWTFQHGEFSAWGIFWHEEFLALEHFSTWLFWHLAKQYGHSSTDISGPVLLCRNVHVPKYPSAENSSCRKGLMPKSPHVKMFLC